MTIILCLYHVVLCGNLSLSNGQVSYDPDSENEQYPVGTTASFTCDSGYNLKGPNSRTCQNSGTWTECSLYCEKSKKIFIAFCTRPTVLKSLLIF